MEAFSNPAFSLFVSALLLTDPAAADAVLVAKSILYPGQEVTESSLTQIEVRGHVLEKRQFLRDPEQAIGKIAARTILPRTLIFPSDLKEANLVRAGTLVKAVYRDGALEITLLGVPLEDGAAGQIVRLRNRESGRQFSGVVRTDGSVLVGTQ
jgi:flagellar basal body P-ring formation protein FlgA